MYADLHLHSVFSDGTDTPGELCDLSISNNIKVISITDHDSIEGIKYLQNDDKAKSVNIIPGIEISTVYNHKYLHMLGYYIDIHNKSLIEFIKLISVEKTENTRINFENALSKGCFSYSWARVLEINNGQPSISGVHVVKAMELDNYRIAGMSVWDMFHKYFWAESPDFIETETMTGYDAIDIILKSDGLPIIAHPKSIGDDGIISDLIKYGVKGLEVFHPIHRQLEIEKYQQMAINNNLLITGGSDWHGKNNNPNITVIGMTGLEHREYEILNIYKERYL